LNKPLKFYVENLGDLELSDVNLVELISMQLKENPGTLTDEVRILSNDIILSDNLYECDFILLPHVWHYYVRNSIEHEITKFQEKSREANKPLIIFNRSDYPSNLSSEGLILLESSSYQSRREKTKSQILGLPPLISDYLKIYNHDKMTYREKGEKPVIGFCGQAGGSEFDFSRRYLNNLFQRMTYQIGKRPFEPAPFETTRFRQNILSKLSQNPLVETDFIIRDRYRAGVKKSERTNDHITRLEFVNNILNTDYTVCVRGGGNFSVRFYETLCLGRIPIFINTDCILPFDDEIDYRKYCIWIEPSEIPYISEKVGEYHSSLSSQGFVEKQYECRNLWVNYFSLSGYYSHLMMKLRR